MTKDHNSGPRQGKRARPTSNVGTSKYGGTSRSAGLTRNRRDVRPFDDEQMNSAISGTNHREPDVRPEHDIERS